MKYLNVNKAISEGEMKVVIFITLQEGIKQNCHQNILLFWMLNYQVHAELINRLYSLKKTSLN